MEKGNEEKNDIKKEKEKLENIDNEVNATNAIALHHKKKDDILDLTKKYNLGEDEYVIVKIPLEFYADVEKLFENRNQKETTVKGTWTKKEDEQLLGWVKKLGAKKWMRIAEKMRGRNGKQCRERFLNHLDPSINHGEWKKDEDEIIMDMHEKVGNQWAKISRKLIGRTPNMVKNRWNSTLWKVIAKKRQMQVRYYQPIMNPNQIPLVNHHVPHAFPIPKPIPPNNWNQMNHYPPYKFDSSNNMYPPYQPITGRKRKVQEISSFPTKETLDKEHTETEIFGRNKKRKRIGLPLPRIMDRTPIPNPMIPITPQRNEINTFGTFQPPQQNFHMKNNYNEVQNSKIIQSDLSNNSNFELSKEKRVLNGINTIRSQSSGQLSLASIDTLEIEKDKERSLENNQSALDEA